ncbi:hypothetical protein [Bordetella sp. BOR01]|uniref:hypothetical protein n=1 Tax=Bordetella sp. BOR01 TaxID=2854779 RepID=UPI001C488485|nr:hypothetical protein [Bordetella sp. BOR01]MBV7486077.1 hypothetical protein [Bordetella sp. BOR01]
MTKHRKADARTSPPGEAERRHASPLAEGAQVPHSDWSDPERDNGAGTAPAGSRGAGHEVAGDRRVRDQGDGRQPRAPADPAKQAGAGSAAHHGSGTGGEARIYEQGAKSGDYEGTGVNRGYGIESGDAQRRNTYREAREGKFGDVEDNEDLYGEGREPDSR